MLIDLMVQMFVTQLKQGWIYWENAHGSIPELNS